MGNLRQESYKRMEINPEYRRLLTTIRREEPDRVPLAELTVDAPVKEAFLNKPVN